MKLVPKYEIRSKAKIIQFLNEQPVGRIGSIDERGYPQIIPMNFVYVEDMGGVEIWKMMSIKQILGQSTCILTLSVKKLKM